MKIHSGTIHNFPDGIKSFPTKLMNESHAQKIHSQSLERLDERGGMGYLEIIVNIFGLSFQELIRVGETKEHGDLLKHIKECLEEKSAV